MERLSFLDQLLHKVSIHGTSQVNMQGAMIIDPAKGKQKITAMALAEHVAARLSDLKLLRKKLVQDRFKLGDIKLIDDPAFDMWNHITFSTLPTPGDHGALIKRLGQFSAEPLDLTRPLWRFEIIEGLEGGKFAVAQKFSHATMDGMAAMRLMQRLFDTEPKKIDKYVPDEWQVDPEPTELNLFKAALSENTDRMVARVPKVSLKASLSAVGAAVAMIQKKLYEEGTPGATQTSAAKPPRTSINQAISLDKRNIAYVAYEVDKLKAIGKTLGYTLNDLCLAMTAEAMDSYFEGIGEELDGDLLFIMPVSTRDTGHKKGEGGNLLRIATVNTHTTIQSLSKRLEAIHKQTGDAKEKRIAAAQDGNGVSFDEATAALSPLVADGIGMLLMNLILPKNLIQLPANAVMTNVPGPRESLYFAGMPVERSIPIVPVAQGAALSIGVTSMGDSITIGFHACGKCVRKTDMHLLTEGLDRAYAELCVLAEKSHAKAVAAARPSASTQPAPAKVTKAPARKTAGRKAKTAPKPGPAQQSKTLANKAKPAAKPAAPSVPKSATQ